MRARPALRLATADAFEPLRKQIEGFVDSLPDDSGRRLVRKREDLENIVQTVNEIKVGLHLSSLECKLEYEKQIDGLTPDWFVDDFEDIGTALVEVFTKQQSDEQMLGEEHIEDLRQRLRTIPIGAVLPLHLYLAAPKIHWSNSLVDLLVLEIEKWIGTSPQIGTKICVEGIEIELWRYSDGLKHVEIIAQSDAFWVDSFPAKRMIEEKHNKYANICADRKLPLIVACAPNFSTALDGYHFEEIAPELFSGLQYLQGIWALLHDGMVKLPRPAQL